MLVLWAFRILRFMASRRFKSFGSSFVLRAENTVTLISSSPSPDGKGWGEGARRGREEIHRLPGKPENQPYFNAYRVARAPAPHRYFCWRSSSKFFRLASCFLMLLSRLTSISI